MEIGSRLRRARLEAGLSQRELCRDIITRNMLSQIENGSALPSIPTLEALAQRLELPVGWFFGESGGFEDALDPVWKTLEAGEPLEAEKQLEQIRGGSSRERGILKTRIQLKLAEQAIREERVPYGASLLEHLDTGCAPELERTRLLLLCEAGHPEAAENLPSLDRELLLRAAQASDPQRAARLLDAAEDWKDPDWAFLRGRIWLSEKEYRRAAECFHLAETAYPRKTAELLEICYRELGNFQQAYYYACRQRLTALQK